MRVAQLPSLFAAVLAWTALATPAVAQSSLSLDLPLGPCYKPGKYVPVHVRATITEPGEKWVVVAAQNVTDRTAIGLGAIRTGVSVTTGRLDAVVPWMVVDSRAGRPRLFVEGRPESFLGPQLRALEAGERLVAWTSPDEVVARQLLSTPDEPMPVIVPIQLDPARPLPGHAAAWEALDLLVLDATSAARTDPSQVAALVAGGVTVAVRGGPAPAMSAWPWAKVGDYSVLRHTAVGPVGGGPAGALGADGYPAAFRPVLSWEPGWPWAFRRRLLLIAAAACVPLLGLALWRPPLAWLWSAGYLAAVVTFMSYWWEAQLLIQQAGGEVVVRTDALTQTDGWTYQTTTEARHATLRWVDVTHPVFASRRGMDSTWLNLTCDTAGRPTHFHARIPPRATLAYLSRAVGPRAPQTMPQTPVTSPLAALAPDLYGAAPVGELPGSVTPSPAYGYLEARQWNAVVIDRRGKN